MPATTAGRGARLALVVVVWAVGAVVAIAAVIAAVFERDGFGRPRDTEPRLWYLALLAVVVALAVGIPVALVAWRTKRHTALVAASVVGTVAGCALLGLAI